ncbi:MAG: bactofilin family protein [Thermodesulfobacteriota bacterium]
MGMFDKKRSAKPVKPDASHFTTSIGEECVFEGHITTSSSTRIDGKLKGKISGENTLIVGERGVILGEVKASEVIVYGRIEGIIDSERLEIKSSGAVTGDIFIDRLVIEEGGVYNGRCGMSEHVGQYVSEPGAIESKKAASETIELEPPQIRAKEL